MQSFLHNIRSLLAGQTDGAEITYRYCASEWRNKIRNKYSFQLHPKVDGSHSGTSDSLITAVLRMLCCCLDKRPCAVHITKRRYVKDCRRRSTDYVRHTATHIIQTYAIIYISRIGLQYGLGRFLVVHSSRI